MEDRVTVGIDAKDVQFDERWPDRPRPEMTTPAGMMSHPQRADADRFRISLKVGNTVGPISGWKLSVFERLPLLSQRRHL